MEIKIEFKGTAEEFLSIFGSKSEEVKSQISSDTSSNTVQETPKSTKTKSSGFEDINNI